MSVVFYKELRSAPEWETNAVQEILRRNPQVDVKLAEEYMQYLHKLRAAGIDIAPKYQISPALGLLPSRTVSQGLRQGQDDTKP